MFVALGTTPQIGNIATVRESGVQIPAWCAMLRVVYPYRYSACFPLRKFRRIIAGMKWIVPLVLFSMPCFSEKNGRAPCNVHNRGRLWPDQANTDPVVASKAGRCGQLLMCSLVGFKYDWQPLTVHVSQLGKAHGDAIPGCAQNAGKGNAPRDSEGASGQSPSGSGADEPARRL